MEAFPVLETNAGLFSAVVQGCRDRGIEVSDEDDEGAVPNPNPETAAPEEQAAPDSLTLYLRQIGGVPLLGADGEREAAKRLEFAENKAIQLLEKCGTTAQQLLALLNKLHAGSERFDLVCDGGPESRAAIKDALPGLIAELKALVGKTDRSSCEPTAPKAARKKMSRPSAPDPRPALLRRILRKAGIQTAVVLRWAAAVNAPRAQAEELRCEESSRGKGFQ